MKGKEMTAAQKRVAIAKDVIAQLRAKAIKPTNDGWYVYPEFDNDGCAGKDLQAMLPDLGRCEVCAIGAAFLSAVRLFDGVKTNGGPINYLATGTISKWFGRDQRLVIESAFEGSWGDRFGYVGGIRKPSDRLEVIMRNIIRNEGMFRPTMKDFHGGRALASMA